MYIAKAPSTAAAFDGQGNVWTKIYQSGLLKPSTDPELQLWATSIVNATGGKHSVVIPASLPAGEYLLRPEIVRLLLLLLGYESIQAHARYRLRCTMRRRTLALSSTCVPLPSLGFS